MSYTKDPVVAAAFAAGGSTLVACYDQQVLQAEGPLHDFSGMEGAVRLAKALPRYYTYCYLFYLLINTYFIMTPV